MHIRAALGIKTIVQLVEVGIGLTIAIFLASKLVLLFDGGLFSNWRSLGVYFAQLFGFSFYSLFFGILSAVLVVMAGRWIMSWASNNGGQTPNNKGN